MYINHKKDTIDQFVSDKNAFFQLNILSIISIYTNKGHSGNPAFEFRRRKKNCITKINGIKPSQGTQRTINKSPGLGHCVRVRRFSDGWQAKVGMVSKSWNGWEWWWVGIKLVVLHYIASLATPTPRASLPFRDVRPKMLSLTTTKTYITFCVLFFLYKEIFYWCYHHYGRYGGRRCSPPYLPPGQLPIWHSKSANAISLLYFYYVF